MYPFQLHSIALSTFASLIGPFGGFFASGFKRAFKIKVRKTVSQFCSDSLFELGLVGFFLIIHCST